MRKIFLKQKKRGVALLIAVLVSSIVLVIGLGVYERTYKASLFSSFWKQSQIAFSAADAGLECALFYDLHPSLAISCFGTTPSGWDRAMVEPYNQKFEADTSFGGCAKVTIIKNGETRIESRGYNVPCSSSNPRQVERGIKIDY